MGTTWYQGTSEQDSSDLAGVTLQGDTLERRVCVCLGGMWVERGFS